jgi:hypothetical protein
VWGRFPTNTLGESSISLSMTLGLILL